MTTILRARPVVSLRIQKLKERAAALKSAGKAPKMRVILVGNNPASLVYIDRKRRLCGEVGCEFELIELGEDISREDFLRHVDEMNNDKTVTGCFVQLPVPSQLKDIDVTALIAPEKDIDGFGQASIVEMYKGKDALFTPCTPKGILSLLEHYQVEVSGKNVAVIGRSLIVGKPMSLLLQNRGATVSMCHSLTRNLEFFTQNADIVVSAVGKARFLGRKHFRKDQSQTIIDVGMSRDAQGKLCGDVDFAEVKNLVKGITPVPGGVGPLTVLSLVENLILATERQSLARIKG